MIRGSCGACKTGWKAAPSLAGRTSKCPTCGNIFSIPRPTPTAAPSVVPATAPATTAVAPQAHPPSRQPGPAATGPPPSTVQVLPSVASIAASVAPKTVRPVIVFLWRRRLMVGSGVALVALLLWVAWLVDRTPTPPANAPAVAVMAPPQRAVDAGDANMWAGAWLIAAIIGGSLLTYFAPSLIANGRGHQDFPAILALNLLLGWTFIGWVWAFVWSLTEVRGRVHLHHHHHHSPP